jgi:hypothetical protein
MQALELIHRDQKQEQLRLIESPAMNRLALLMLLAGLAVWPILGHIFGSLTDGLTVSVYVITLTLTALPIALVVLFASANMLSTSFGPLLTGLFRVTALLAFFISAMLLACALAGTTLWLALALPLVIVTTMYLFAKLFDLEVAEALITVILFASLGTALTKMTELALQVGTTVLPV